jgi:uncharacterized protein (DUF1778 family)
MTFNSRSSAATKPVNLRVRDDVKSLIDRAAQAQGRSRSDFMIDASRRAAEEALLDQTLFVAGAETYQAFLEALDRTPEPNQRLIRTLRTSAPWDKA